MSSHTLGLLLGGVLPALIFGVGTISQKASTQAGIGLGPFLLATGVGVFLVGTTVTIATVDRSFTPRSLILATGLGLAWSSGTALVTLALLKFGSPISQLTPLYNMNTLVAVPLALWIFAEWKQVHTVQLLVGSALIVIGGTLVARA